jgi:tRNA modification GTPase
MSTIAAICTAPGMAAIGVIRLSGPKSISILTELFQSRKPIFHFETQKAYVGKLMDSETLLDEVVVTLFRAPHSYTGENIVEISCHGGRVILEKTLQALLRRGARMADPGEFTQRAFVNGKMDLLQAEAVEDLIRAESDLALEAAQQLLQGKLSEWVESLKNRLIHSISGFEAEIEFPDEHDVVENLHTIIAPRLEQIEEIATLIQKLLDSFEQGILLREGFTVAIFGSPNTGKSTLLNRLLGFDRSIVSSEPGTTRDYIREKMFIHGLPVTLVDMAGIRANPNQIEQIGIDRCKSLLENASLALFMMDSSRPMKEDDRLAFASCPASIPKLWVWNKMDLPLQSSKDDPLLKDADIVPVSALQGTGIEILIQKIRECLGRRIVPEKTELVLTHLRHKNSLHRCHALLTKVKKEAHSLELELTVYDLRQALRELQILTGEVTVDEIMNHIFSTFCIGK